MVTALRLLQILVFLLTIPMIALGGMSMLSGGGMTPAYQKIGSLMFASSLYISVPAIILSEIIYRVMKHTRLLPEIYVIPVIIVAILPVIWIGLIVWLQFETGFFG